MKAILNPTLEPKPYLTNDLPEIGRRRTAC